MDHDAHPAPRPKLISFDVFGTALLLCFATAGRADPARQLPKVWFAMGAISSSPGHHSWELLFYQPDPIWPPYMEHVTVIGILTQALLKIPDAELTKVAARLKEKRMALGIEMLAQADNAPRDAVVAWRGITRRPWWQHWRQS
jgi:hypothetical protein